MVYYVIIVFFIFAFPTSSTIQEDNVAYEKQGVYLKLYLIFLMFSIIPIVSSLTSEKGDYPTYVDVFYKLPNIFDKDFFSTASELHGEIGYDVLQGLFKLFCNSVTLFFILFCGFSFLFRLQFIKEFVHIDDVLLCFVAFLGHEFLRKDFIQIRNGMASSIILWAFISLYKGYKFKFLLKIIVASSIHSVAIICIPFILLNEKIINSIKHKYLSIFFIVFVVSIILDLKQILIFITSKISFLQVISYYLDTFYAEPLSLMHPIMLKQSLIVCIILLNRKKIVFNKKSDFLFFLYYCSTLLYLVFRSVGIFGGRFGGLYYGVEAALLLNLIYESSNNIYIKKILLYIFYVGIFFVNFVTNDHSLWGPKFL